MKNTVPSEIRELIHAVHYRPAVSIIMPFEPNMVSKSVITEQLQLVVGRAEKEILENYPGDISILVINKMRQIINHLNFTTNKKSIAIFVSPVFEKVLYLDVPVEQRLIIDESFEIRDLLYAKKDVHKYLVLTLSGKTCKSYLGNTDTFVMVKSDVSDHISANVNDAPERVSNFSDPSERNEMLLKKFLGQVDKGLSYLLEVYKLPAFVLGATKVIGYFKAITKNRSSIISYVHGNYEDATEYELANVLQPYINDWKKVRMRELSLKLEAAASANKLTLGIENVWEKASHKQGSLLVVEKNFTYAADVTVNDGHITEVRAPYNKFSYIRDAVDDIIEKILEYGGDVEFVDPGILPGDKKIALITYY